MNSVTQHFTNEYLAKLEAVSFSYTGKTDSGWQGTRKSRAKGHSLEFSDFKDYTPGDDVRRIDWKAYSRLNRLYIKLFMEEKQACISIFLDKSKSMDFGEPNKLYFAKLFAATLTYISVKNADRVGLYTFDREISLPLENISSKNLFARVLRFLDEIEPSGQTSIVHAVQTMRNKPMGRGASFILSDFFSGIHADAGSSRKAGEAAHEADYETAVKWLRAKGQEVYLVHILSPEEISPHLLGAKRLKDSETGLTEDILLSESVLDHYAKALDAYRNNIMNSCRKQNAHYIFSPTDTPLLKLFASERDKV